MNSNLREPTLNDSVDRFIFRWDEYIIDYWWRKKYNVAFGSSIHREMNFIDMLIEYREQIQMIRANRIKEKEELSIGEEDDNVVQMTDEEIDEEYENLDLSKL